MSDSKPREFWLWPNKAGNIERVLEEYDAKTAINEHFLANNIHVIEYEAYSKLLADNQRLREALVDLLNDTQHIDHDCGQESVCPVYYARQALAETKGEG